MGEGAAKVFGGSRAWRSRDQAGLLEPRRAVTEYGYDGGPGSEASASHASPAIS